MKASDYFRIFVCVFALWGASTALGQTTAGAGSVIVIPNAAITPSFPSDEISVQNPNATTLTLDVLFYEANSAAVPGLRPCSALVLTAGQSLTFNLSTQCTLGAGNHHGMLILQAASDLKTNVFYAHGRLQTPKGIGYTVEGYPIGNFSGQTANSLGLKRSAAGNKFQSNCFVGALGETLNYKIQLFDGAANTQLGSDIVGILGPYQMIRYLDIFTFAAAPAGDYTNVRAQFSVTTGDPSDPVPALVGYCTVQESITFNSDFRIAKSQEAFDFRQERQICYGQVAGSCGTVLPPGAATQIGDPTIRNIHSLFIAQPDFVKCDLVGDAGTLANLQMRLRVPNDVFGSPVFVPTAPYDGAPFTAGGANQTGFYVFTGNRSEVNDGFTARWFIDVEARTSTAPAPLDYGITCIAGNGVSVPYLRDDQSSAVPF